MTYYLDGLVYRIFSVGGILLFIGATPFLLDKFLLKQSSQKKTKIIFGSATILSSIYILFYLFLLLNPTILVHQGYFVSAHRNSRVAPPLPLTMEYSFSNGTQLKPVFYLDVISKKKIFNQEFDQNKEYIIYYEEHTNIIVKVEEVSNEVPSIPTN